MEWQCEESRKQHNEPDKFPNTEFINKDLGFINIRRSFYLATCKYFIYDHSNLVSEYRRRKGQSVIFISHGFGVKAGKGITQVRNSFDINVVLGKIPAENAALDWGGTYNQTRQWGYPRNDYLFQNNTIIKEKLNKFYSLSDYKKVFIWMPTFRQAISYGAALSEEYIHNETGLPLFHTVESLFQFDHFLKSIGCIVIMKLHPLQANLPVFDKRYDNIKVIRNEDLQNIDVQLYQLLGLTDCLITDYSSVSTDYMLLNKPIIYILDDIKEYEANRGLSPANAIELLVGYHVYNIEQLENSIFKVVNGIDEFKDATARWREW